jgi:membrane-bound lytic murein transglycosylase F
MRKRCFFFKYLNVLLWVLVAGHSLISCRKAPETTVLDDILATGELRVITRNNPWCYSLYRGQPRGFEYELAKAFADYLGVSLNVQIAHRWDRIIPDLLAGQGDLIAANMTITPGKRARVAFSHGYLSMQPHVIIRRQHQKIRSFGDLAGKTVHVTQGTSYHERLMALQATGVALNIALHTKLETIDLIRMVADQTIDITIADRLVALLSRRYYPSIDIAAPIGKSENLGWAVNPKASKLLNRINEFFTMIRQNGEFDRIYNRYYFGIDDFDFVDVRAFHRKIKKKFSAYRMITRQIADQYDFDWRLIAAQMYQESRFDPLAVSYRGAHGLMQITLKAAEDLDVIDIYDACQNIEAGVRHLKDLFDFYDHAEGDDRLLLALAAYNIGVGHLLDARNLAREQGLNPEKWSSLKKTLPLLIKPEYYQKTQYGYCRGTEPIEYINKIYEYYDILRFKSVVARID